MQNSLVNKTNVPTGEPSKDNPGITAVCASPDGDSDDIMPVGVLDGLRTAAKDAVPDEGLDRLIASRNTDGSGAVMRWDDAERFLTAYEKKGRSQATLEKYRLALEQFYDKLPEDKRIYCDTLSIWRNELLKAGYYKASVNVKISALNQFLAFIGKREYQVVGQLAVKDGIQPELTRNEYRRLLSAAKALNDERTYFVVKVFACTGINVQELPQITVENVTAGRFTSSYLGVMRSVWIPDSLRRELIAFARRNGIRSGALFLSRSGRPLNRTTVTNMTACLSDAARVPREKCNPRCLKKLYLSTRATVEANIEILIEQAMERQLEEEQLIVGWGA